MTHTVNAMKSSSSFPPHSSGFCYRPPTKLRKGSVLVVCVCPRFGGGGRSPVPITHDALAFTIEAPSSDRPWSWPPLYTQGPSRGTLYMASASAPPNRDSGHYEAHTVDKRVVGILLECILVCNFQIHCGYEGPMSSDKEICNQINAEKLRRNYMYIRKPVLVWDKSEFLI